MHYKELPMVKELDLFGLTMSTVIPMFIADWQTVQLIPLEFITVLTLKMLELYV